MPIYDNFCMKNKHVYKLMFIITGIKPEYTHKS